MPQLLSRRDDAGWLTPAMADILVQRTAPLVSEDMLRDQIAVIQQRLADLETPIRIVDIHPSPSHILYVARPETRRGSRKSPTPAEIRRNLGKLAEEREDWTLGFMNQVGDDPETVGILLRVPQHQPVKLRQVLLSNTFQHHPSTLAVVLGVTLEQQIILRDLATAGHLLAIGSQSAVRHLTSELLASLTMLNTPAELRLALLGASSAAHREFIHTPHALGRLLDSPENGQRLLDGMVKEVQRRHQWFAETQANTLEAYNAHLLNRGESPLPRILLLLSSLSDPAWKDASESWSPAVYDLIINGGRVGVYMILTAEQAHDVPDIIEQVIETRVVMRSAASPALVENLRHLHNTALRFVDAFVTGKGEDVTPVELCTVSDADMGNLVDYWRQAAAQRSREVRRERTGLTDLLPELEGSGLGTTETPHRATGPLPTRTRAGILARATQVLSGEEANEKLLAQSMTLAAYLGWLGIGPLRDIFGLSAAESRAILAALQTQGVIEEGEGPVYRFLRLAGNPLENEADD
ncbi:MAG TPA: FtsK/SpoIIIE domain-containing protein [Spirillospora sp.]|nr:FtsK/SpoIIIE domain-containing protein [Spirillospora sp.]